MEKGEREQNTGVTERESVLEAELRGKRKILSAIKQRIHM
jgi:hypothetical protein